MPRNAGRSGTRCRTVLRGGRQGCGCGHRRGKRGRSGQCLAQNTTPQPTVIVSPGWYDDYVLTVASVAADGAPSAFSLNGPWVDVAAHGEAVLSLDPDGDGLVDAMPGSSGPMPISGTSYATPVVSGLVALVRARFPRMSARQVMAKIEATAHKPVGAGMPRWATASSTAWPR